MPNENSSEDWQEGTERSEYDGLFVWRVLDAMARRRTLAAACEVLGAASVKASQAISALERSWGVRFVSRTTHLVGLTLLGAE